MAPARLKIARFASSTTEANRGSQIPTCHWWTASGLSNRLEAPLFRVYGLIVAVSARANSLTDLIKNN